MNIFTYFSWTPCGYASGAGWAGGWGEQGGPATVMLLLLLSNRIYLAVCMSLQMFADTELL